MVDNNIMPTSGQREIDPITLAKIKQQAQDREYDIVEEPIGRIKLKNYTSEDSTLANEKPFISYYCSLCGDHAFVSSVPLIELPRRRTDFSLIIPASQSMVFQRYMAPGDIIGVRRENGIEKQWRWKCKGCNIDLGYQCVNFDSKLPNEIAPQLYKNTNSVKVQAKNPNKLNFYILRNALATDVSCSELLEEFARLNSIKKRQEIDNEPNN
ncbi:unnamed protein product [Blepharisma stoltei]|uniref:STEEP1 domain-containing protein n=1 Tax=Blepharisma stoltei TaxID=1481888 RepID=A0AAU9KIL1_9CILI|nr:unnamed protein product [Blepharisma stoltei]